jgi:alkylation response protein AidB-like acyl-CoA dehydrogenase
VTSSPTPWCFAAWGDEAVADDARAVAGEVEASLTLARDREQVAGTMGRDTWRVLSALATLGSVDLTAARTVEPHWDAVAILEQAGAPAPKGATWGVYAAAPPGTRLAAHRGGDGWLLTGAKPWCSLADRVSHALVTADVDGGPAGLFAVDLHDTGVSVDPGAWVARGLRDVTTSTVTFDAVPASPVGAPGWYLDRPGFAWGGIGVAAVWFGGAAALAGALWAAARTRQPDQVALMHLGACDVSLHGTLLGLRDAAAAIDDGRADGAAGRLLASRVRAQAAACAEQVIATVGHALGPAPLAMDAVHAARVADLTLYVRQHHAERDLAALGRLVAPEPGPAGDRAAGAGSTA